MRTLPACVTAGQKAHSYLSEGQIFHQMRQQKLQYLSVLLSLKRTRYLTVTTVKPRTLHTGSLCCIAAVNKSYMLPFLCVCVL